MQKARGQAGPKARRPPTARRHGVSGSVSSPGRGSSHRSVALLGSLSVVIEYLALRDGPRRFRPGFTCPTLLGYRLGESHLRLRGYHPLWRPFPRDFGSRRLIPCHRPHDPERCPTRFRLVPVRSPLLRESRLLSFPPGTEMFQFPGFAAGIPGSTLVGQLPRTFRSLPRPLSMTPRHPPRALRSLTTPIRPPRAPEENAANRAAGVKPRESCSRPKRLATRRPPAWVTIPVCGPVTSQRQPSQFRKGPHSWRMRICATSTTYLVVLLA